MKNNRSDKYRSPAKAIITGVSDLFRRHERVGEIKPTDRLDGKKVLITGASSGLGFAVARQLAERGATVIMACRSGIPGKGEEIAHMTGSNDVHMVHVDLADSDSIVRMVGEVKKRFGAIDIFISSAGIVARKGRKTKLGPDEMFVVNYLAPFVLVNLLLKEELIGRPGYGTARMIFVSSETHRNPKAFGWEGFGRFRTYGMSRSVELYGYYKLLLTTFVNELSRRLNAGGHVRYSIFALCPGPINSNIAREAPALIQLLLKVIFKLFFRSPEKAAGPVVYLSVSPDMEGKALDYLFLMSRKEMDPKATDPANGKRLWELTEKLFMTGTYPSIP